VHYIANAKIQDNQESEVGLVSMAGSRVTVHCSMSRSVGAIMNCLKDDVKVGGEARFINGLKIAQLGLKNRHLHTYTHTYTHIHTQTHTNINGFGVGIGVGVGGRGCFACIAHIHTHTYIH
jgi:hypothetical protein